MDKVPIEQLVDLGSLRSDSQRPTPKQIREALPPGWVLEQDGLHARRDLRVLARDGWVLVIGLVLFGGAGFFLFYDSFPRGWRGIGRFGFLVALILLAGGIVGPMVTRALIRKPKG
ncbi:MAG: hypothetical protein O2816_04805 [Planctomycetota bacterium]|nr:hypothetical protein [Planctomycetota bacterium]